MKVNLSLSNPNLKRMQKIIPTGTNLLVLPYPETETKTKSGLILPNPKYESTFRKGTIEAIGKGDKHNLMKEFKIGDIVYYDRIAENRRILIPAQNDIGQIVIYEIVPYEKIPGHE